MEVPTTVDGLVAAFERGDADDAGTGDLFDQIVEKLGAGRSAQLWSDACYAFDLKHAPEEFL